MLPSMVPTVHIAKVRHKFHQCYPVWIKLPIFIQFECETIISSSAKPSSIQNMHHVRVPTMILSIISLSELQASGAIERLLIRNFLNSAYGDCDVVEKKKYET